MDLLRTIISVFYLIDFISASPLINGKYDKELYYFHKNGLKHGYLLVRFIKMECNGRIRGIGGC